MNGRKKVLFYLVFGVAVAACATMFFNHRRKASIKSAADACAAGGQTAAASCDAAIRLDPANTLIYTLGRAAANASIGKNAEAASDYGRAAAMQGKTPAAAGTWLAIGKLKGAAEDGAGAIAAFTQAIALNPKLVPAFSGRAASYAASGNAEAAVRDFGAALLLNSSDTVSLNGRAAVYLNAGLLTEAVNDASAAIAVAPAAPDAYVTRAMAYQGLGRWQESVKDCSRIIELSPSPAAFSCRAEASFMLKDYRQAVADYTQAVTLDAGSPEPYISRGVALRSDGQYDKSLADFNKAQELNPDIQNIYFERALSSLCLNDLKSAEADLDKAASFEETQPRFHVVKAALVYAKSRGRDKAGAMAELRAAHSLGGPDALACITNPSDAGRFLAPLARNREVAQLLSPVQKPK